jgi:putative transposase
VHLQHRFGVSERRACTVVGQNRATQRKPPRPLSDLEQRLRAWLRAFSAKHPRWGWRRATACARGAGFDVNAKRVQRLWRDEGLKVPYRRKKRPLLGLGVQVGAFCPARPNVVWAIDFQFDQTDDAKVLKLLNIIDEYTRECLAIEVARSITADKLVSVLERLVAHRGAPTTCVSTTAPSSSPTRWPTGAGSTALAASSSNPAARGKTPGWRASTDGSGTSS